jgi:hypothetical protein
MSDTAFRGRSRFSGKHTVRNTIVDNAHISGGIMKVAHQDPAT